MSLMKSLKMSSMKMTVSVIGAAKHAPVVVCFATLVRTILAIVCLATVRTATSLGPALVPIRTVAITPRSNLVAAMKASSIARSPSAEAQDTLAEAERVS